MRSIAPVGWDDFVKRYFWFDSIGLGLDLSRTTMPIDYAEQNREMVARALKEMSDLEAGAIANPDEGRMVGHYWLRNSNLAPDAEIRVAIEQMISDVKTFASDVHAGRIRGAAGRFEHVLLIGIGGSALGPQFVSHALTHPNRDKMRIHFLDNTDPDGFDRVFAQLDQEFGKTLCVVVSKSGATKETRNGMLETTAAYSARGLRFAEHAVAITGEGSELHSAAQDWIRTFPMWDWVGGRTSELSAVGLLPAALTGYDVDQLLDGAKAVDNVTRMGHKCGNPAILLALYWHYIVTAVKRDTMVVMPYKDRLEYLSKYLQQLVMESLGKRVDKAGHQRCVGLTVFGNKGSTDQHAYVQQLRDGPNDFFCVFINALNNQPMTSIEVEPRTTSGDYLQGFLLGTREALFSSGRESVLLTIPQITERSVAGLIALFERTVGYYAAFLNVNAYNQPGVEAGKKAATNVIQLQSALLDFLCANKGRSFSTPEIAEAISAGESTDLVFKVCQHLAANGRIVGSRIHEPTTSRFGC